MEEVQVGVIYNTLLDLNEGDRTQCLWMVYYDYFPGVWFSAVSGAPWLLERLVDSQGAQA